MLHRLNPRLWAQHAQNGVSRACDGFTAGKWRLIAAFRMWIAIGIAFYLFAMYPNVLNDWFDANLAVLRWVGNLPRFGQHLEAFLRFFNAERLLILPEIAIPILVVSWLARHTTARARKARVSKV